MLTCCHLGWWDPGCVFHAEKLGCAERCQTCSAIPAASQMLLVRIFSYWREKETRKLLGRGLLALGSSCSLEHSQKHNMASKNCTQGHSHAKYGEEGFFSPITFLTPKCFCWIHSTWNVELNEYWHYLLKLRELESKGTDLLLKRWEQLAVSERLWSSQGREHNRNTGNTNSWRADHVLELLE